MLLSIRMRDLSFEAHPANPMTCFKIRVCFAVLWLVGATGCAQQDALLRATTPSRAEPSWSQTDDGPSGVRLLGWGEVVLSNGLVLGVGQAKGEMSSIGFVFRPGLNRWERTPLVPGVIALGGHLVAQPDGQALGFGLARSERQTVAVKFDSAKNEWRRAGMLPEPSVDTIGHDVVRLTNSRFLLLGRGGARNGWIYNADTETWAQTATLPVEVSEVLLVIPLGDRRVFALFGDKTRVQGWIGMVYDAALDSWLPGRASATTMRGEPDSVVRLRDGSILLLGFQQYPTIAFAPVIFRPDAMVWESAGQLPRGEFLEARSLTLLPNQNVLALQRGVAGGKMRAILFDPVRRTWRVDSDLPDGYSGGAILKTRQDGSVCAILFRSNVLRDELVRAPSDGAWTMVGALPPGSVAWGPGGTADTMLLYTGPNDGGDSTIDGALLFRP